MRWRERGSYYQASYTVEASYVMAIVLLALAFLIRTAVGQYRQETGIMQLQYWIERARGQGREGRWDFSAFGWQGSVRAEDTRQWSLENLPWEGMPVEGTLQGDDWQKEISVHVHSPEELMRMMALLEWLKNDEGDKEDGGTERSGNQLSPGDDAELSDDRGS